MLYWVHTKLRGILSMKIMKRSKFIVAISLAVLIAFGAVIVYGFNASTATEVLAAETQERAINFGGGNNDNRSWVNSRAMFSEQDWNSQNELQRRFPYSQSDFNGRFATMGDWSMFNVNGFDNLEINLVNGNVIFALNEDNMTDFFASHSVTEKYRAFIVPNQIWVNGYIPSANNSTVYIIDNTERSNQNSTLTISVPRSDVWLFDSINIIVENGNVEIADIFKSFLAESITINTINGDVVRVNDNEVVHFSPNMGRVESPAPSSTPRPTPTPRPQDATTGFEELRQAGNTMRETFPYRFPYSDANADIFSVSFNGGWDTRVANLEINLQNADLRIVPLEANRTFWGFHRPNTPYAVVVESRDLTTAYSQIRGSGVFIWDSFTAYDGVVTLHVPLNIGWVFESASIHLENGNLEIDEDVKELLAESLNIDVVNGYVIGHETQVAYSLTDAVRIARNHIGLPLESGAGFSTNIIEIDGQRIFHFWVNGCEVLTNLSADAVVSFYEFKICVQTGEVLEFIEGTYPPNARR